MLLNSAVQTLLLLDTYLQLHGEHVFIPLSKDSNFTEPETEPVTSHLHLQDESKCLKYHNVTDTPNLSQTDITRYKEEGEETLQQVQKLWEESKAWEFEGGNFKHGEIFRSNQDDQDIYAVVLRFPLSPCKLANILFSDQEKVAEWNNELEEVNVIAQLDKNLSITHGVSTDYPMIAVREFVDLNLVGNIGNAYFHVFKSVDYPLPVASGRIRATNNPSGFLLQPIQTRTGTECKMTWILNTDYKLNSFVQMIADMRFAQKLNATIDGIKKYVNENS